MKTQCTIETNDSVRTLICLALNGELRLATRGEVRTYMERIMNHEAEILEETVIEMRKNYAPAVPGSVTTIDDIEE